MRVALRKSGYLGNFDEKKNHHALNNTDCKMNELLEDFTWQAEETMKSILKSNYFGASQYETVKPPIFSTKATSDEYNLIHNMSKEDIICETYKILDVLEKNNAIPYEEIFKKEVNGKSKKNSRPILLKTWKRFLLLYCCGWAVIQNKIRCVGSWGRNLMAREPLWEQNWLPPMFNIMQISLAKCQSTRAGKRM